MLGRGQTLGPTALAGGPNGEEMDAVCAAKTAPGVSGLDRSPGASRKPLPPVPGRTGGRGIWPRPGLMRPSAAPRPTTRRQKGCVGFGRESHRGRKRRVLSETLAVNPAACQSNLPSLAGYFSDATSCAKCTCAAAKSNLPSYRGDWGVGRLPQRGRKRGSDPPSLPKPGACQGQPIGRRMGGLRTGHGPITPTVLSSRVRAPRL